MIEALMLALALSIDAFVASIAFGTQKIKIGIKNIIFINFICSFILAISLFFATIIKKYICTFFCSVFGFFIFFIIGFLNIIYSIILHNLKNKKSNTSIKNFKWNDITFKLKISQNRKCAQRKLKKLTYKECLCLATALSVDSLVTGFGSVFNSINEYQLIIASFFVGCLAITLGSLIGIKISKKSKINLNWLSGSILILLAILKFF